MKLSSICSTLSCTVSMLTLINFLYFQAFSISRPEGKKFLEIKIKISTMKFTKQWFYFVATNPEHNLLAPCHLFIMEITSLNVLCSFPFLNL